MLSCEIFYVASLFGPERPIFGLHNISVMRIVGAKGLIAISLAEDMPMIDISSDFYAQVLILFLE